LAVLKVGDEPRLKRALAPRTGLRSGAGFWLLQIVVEEGDWWGFVVAESCLLVAAERWVLDTLNAGPA